MALSVIRRTIFVQVQDTPNPNSLKFIPTGKKLLEPGKTAEFTQVAEAAKRSPLAQSMMRNSGVHSVFIASEFVTVTKKDDVEWGPLKTELFATLMDFIQSGLPTVIEGSEDKKEQPQEDLAPEDETVMMIKGKSLRLGRFLS